MQVCDSISEAARHIDGQRRSLFIAKTERNTELLCLILQYFERGKGITVMENAENRTVDFLGRLTKEDMPESTY